MLKSIFVDINFYSYHFFATFVPANEIGTNGKREHFRICVAK